MKDIQVMQKNVIIKYNIKVCPVNKRWFDPILGLVSARYWSKYGRSDPTL